jgi:ankyrin repeat protein
VGPNLKDSNGRKPLSFAAENGHKAVVKLLLATDSVDADSKDFSGRTPRLYAVEEGHEPLIKLLSMQYPNDPGSQSEDFGIATNDRVENEQNPPIEDRLHILEALQVGPSTDSGFVSTTRHEFEHTQNA